MAPAGRTRNPWVVLAAALFGLFAVGFSITVLSIALKNIAEEFDTTDNVVVWVITGPLLLGAIITAAAGKLVDILGAKRVYLISMGVVAVFAGLAAVSWSAGSLILFRTVGAAIGAATGPAAIALINRLFPKEKRAQALGYWAMVAAGGPVIGAVAGGPLLETVSWRVVFAAQVPLALATVLVCAAIFPETPRRPARFDVKGALLLGFGSGSFVIALNRAPEEGWGWGHPAIVAAFLSAPVLLTLFVLHERRVDEQLIPMRYFAQRNFTVPMVNQFFANFAYMGGFFLTPLLLQRSLGFTPTKTSLVSIVRPLVFAVAGPIAGWLTTRIGERINGTAGGVFLVGSMLMFATIGPNTTEIVVFAALALSGVAMGATAPAMSAAVANTVDEHDLGVAGGTQQMIGQLGVVVGTQVMFTVERATAVPGDVSSGYANGYLVGAAAAVFAAVAAWYVRSTTRAGLLVGAREQDHVLEVTEITASGVPVLESL